MLGALLGDIIGSKYEFKAEGRNDPQFFSENSSFTDDSVCTGAVAKMIHSTYQYDPAEEMKLFCMNYPGAGYGPSFHLWIYDWHKRGYNSYGNGSIMRISPVALYGSNIHQTIDLGRKITEISHDHHDSLLAVEIYLTILHELLNNQTLVDTLDYVEKTYQFSFDSVDNYTKIGGFHINAISTLKRAVASVVEASSFEKTMIHAIKIGSDTDTTCAIAGAIAEILWDIPTTYLEKLPSYFEGRSQEILNAVTDNYKKSPYLSTLPENVVNFVNTN